MHNKIDTVVHDETGNEYMAILKKDLQDTDSALNEFLQLDLLPQIPEQPKNSSRRSFLELKYITMTVENSPSNYKEFAQNVHDLDKHYKLWSTFTNNLTDENLTPSFFEETAKGTDGIINYVKLHFLRPRPYVLAKEFGLAYEPIVDKRYSTASYPSGHACEAFMFAKILQRRHPKFATLFTNLAEKIAHSRIVAGVHFPSDNQGGKILADIIINNNLCKNI